MSNEISSNSVLSNLSLEARQKEAAKAEGESSNNELGQSVFLELMITQLENQDPLSPQENSDFIAQLAQFSSVEGLERLNNSFDGFSGTFRSNRALEASSLVGRSVSVPSEDAHLSENGYVGGSVELPSATANMNINVYDEKGSLVQNIPLGAQSEGELIFRWDGKRIEINGELTDFEAPEIANIGSYRFEVLATLPNEDGAIESQQLETALTANVNSVTSLENGDLILNLSGLGPVNMNDVKQFN